MYTKRCYHVIYRSIDQFGSFIFRKFPIILYCIFALFLLCCHIITAFFFYALRIDIRMAVLQICSRTFFLFFFHIILFHRFISPSIHVMMTSTRYSCCTLLNSLPGRILCHLYMHPLQHVAVACCAMNTGCPRIGVCFPSLGITAGASLFAIKSSA